MSSELLQGLGETAGRLLGEPQAALLQGILFGGSAKFSHDFYQALQITGTLHVVAVSGQNMSILAGFLGRMTGILGWRVSLLLQALGILGYIYLVGGGASVVRSGLMALIALFAKATGRQADSGRALVVAATGMAALHPDFLIDVGWQLSVLATAGIIWLEPTIAAWLKKLPDILASSVSVSLAAEIFTWPIIAYKFGIVSLIALPTNVLVGWTMPWIMALGAVALVSANFVPLLGQAVAWLAWVPLTYFVDIVMFLSRIPLASFNLAFLPIGALVIYYTLLGWGIWRWSVKEA